MSPSGSTPVPDGIVRSFVGARDVASETAAQGPRFASSCHPALINGTVGVIVRPARNVIGVAALMVTDGRIARIDLIIDPSKLVNLNGLS